MFPPGSVAPSVSSFKSDSPLGYQGVYSAEQNAAEGTPERAALNAGYKTADQVVNAALSGAIDPYTALFMLSAGDRSIEYRATEAQMQLLNNLLAKYQSNNSLIWQAQQLQALGLSNAGVLQTGAAHTAQDMSNPSSNRSNRYANIARSLISMAGSMASSGIYGGSLHQVKASAAEAASLTASSMSKYLGNDTEYWTDDEKKFWKGR